MEYRFKFLISNQHVFKFKLISIITEHTIRVSQKLAETCALVFVLSCATLTYLYGSYIVLPEVFAEYSSQTHLLLRIFGAWIYIAVCSNMFLCRKRNSSIRHRMLLQPVVKQMSSHVTNMDSDVQVRETAKHMGEHFTPDPFGDGNNWHICACCEVFVPPRAWHCHACNTCILRRDHHCAFTGCCIGEENQSNFLGLLFYLGVGTSLSSVFALIYSVYFEGVSVLWHFFRCFAMVYTIFFDFQVITILASVNTVGQIAAWGVFGYYVFISMKGQTSADAHRKVTWTSPGSRGVSYRNLQEFLGPNPILRILWPFHEPLRINYSPQVIQEDDRKGL